jgi:ABC-type glycerol-3-phosphate transport system substrate-binding protein
MKKIIAGVCLCLAVVIGLANCNPKPSSSDSLVIWHWMTDRDEAFQQLAKKYEDQTGVKVIFELYAPSDVYSQKIIAAAQAHILPDIFGILDTKKVLADFIESGFVADLSEAFAQNEQAWEKSLFPKAVNVNRFFEGNIYNIKPGIYGVPIDVTNIQMLYNKALLAKVGYQNPPQTFEQFLEIASALKRIGVPGFVSGWGEIWMADCFASNYAFNIMSEEKIMATYRGEIPYTDEDWIKVFGVFDTLRQQDVLIPGIVTKVNKDAEQDFALERAAFAFNGSWCVNVYHDMNADLQYGVMLPPAVNPKRPMSIWGGAGSSFMVHAASQKKEQAIAFLKWITAKEQQAFLSETTRNLPSNREALSSIPQVLAEFAQTMDYTTHPTIWERDEDPLVKEAFTRGIQSIIIGEKTPQLVAAEVQQVKDRQMAKQNNR